MTQQFTHPDTGKVYTLEDSVRYFYIYDDFPKKAGQTIRYESFHLVDGIWRREQSGFVTVDEDDLMPDCL